MRIKNTIKDSQEILLRLLMRRIPVSPTKWRSGLSSVRSKFGNASDHGCIPSAILRSNGGAREQLGAKRITFDLRVAFHLFAEPFMQGDRVLRDRCVRSPKAQHRTGGWAAHSALDRNAATPSAVSSENEHQTRRHCAPGNRRDMRLCV